MRVETPVGELEPVFPNRVRFGGRELTIGGLSYGLLANVIAMGGRAPIEKLAPLVWGRPEVRPNTVELMCCRLSKRLKALGYGGRLGVDRGAVVLYA